MGRNHILCDKSPLIDFVRIDALGHRSQSALPAEFRISVVFSTFLAEFGDKIGVLELFGFLSYAFFQISNGIGEIGGSVAFEAR